MRDPLQALGKALRHVREARGLSQEAVAEAAGVHRTYIGGVERGEYNISLENILRICKALTLNTSDLFLALEASPGPRPAARPRDLLADWEITPDELSSIVSENPSLRGFLLGYVGEHKLRKSLGKLRKNGLELLPKPDDHDRSSKGDIEVRFRGRAYRIELKSLQTNMVRKEGDLYYGKAQCDASDRRRVRLPDGKSIETTCLLVGEFDILALNLFAFRHEWDFVFALNRDLPRSSYKGYSKYVRSQLLATLVNVTWPPRPPFVTDILRLF